MHAQRTTTHNIRLLLRAFVIFWLLVETSVVYALRYLGMRATGKSRADRQAMFGKTVLGLFRRLGATFIKVGQIMSTRPDLLPPHVISALASLQDNVGPFPYPDVERTLSEDFGQPVADLFSEFSRTPIASASVAQVHKARLRSGQLVAVKVRRPDIEELCAFDLSVMSFYARVLELVPSLKLLAPLESVEQFGRAIAMQLDFTIEAANNRRFTANFAQMPEVVVPTLHDPLCSRRVLTMDFIEGKKILDVGGEQTTRRALGELGFRVMLKMIFADGFVHADLHPGNLLVTPEGKVALLDLGLVAEMDDTHRIAFARYFAAWARGDGQTMADIMVSHSPSPYVRDRAGFTLAIQDFVSRLHGKRLGEVEVAKVVYDMLQILRRYRVRVNATFTMVNIAIAVTEGIGKQLDPTLDLLNEAMPFFMALSL
ncbi:MAG TPA: AarF/UbiB family protein [Pseudomonadota bacterium]|jgi:ubiquinone biosynthesis protein|nr:AarF/UbiB family protein [Pseudomonadota bacterium]HNN51599.1 AarF/UbiB family protein [Pseudomonadota bacterium]HNO69122.1 AarF/UbiB family protein [Pseudomonadota bacterium]